MQPPTLDLRTHLLLRELASGDTAAAPAASLALVSIGDAAHCLAEQKLFLPEYLARAAPDVVAGFATPEGVELYALEVKLTRESLPRQLQLAVPLTFTCLRIPSLDGTWVVVAALDFTCFVRRDEAIEDVVRSEVQRLVGALELSPFQFLQLFPARAYRLEPLELAVERSERLPADVATSRRRALAEAEKRRWAREILDSVGTPMHARLRDADVAPLVGREGELRQLGALLGGRERLSVLLSGPTLAGKSAVFRAWLQAHKDRRVWSTSGAQLIAGMSGLGQWEERVRRVIDAAEALDAVLYFDSMGDLLAERTGGGVDLAAAFKPCLEDGRVRLVGELRAELLDSAERHHGALLGNLSRLRIEALDAARSTEALYARIRHDALHTPDRARLRAEAVPSLVDLAERYLPYQSFPGKAVKLYEDLRAVREKDPGNASQAAPVLDADDVYQVFSLQTGVPAFLLRDDRALLLEDVTRHLRARVVGQDRAVRGVAETVCVVKAQLQPAGKPLATFLFVGPTGVGKTELARALAEYLFGAADRMTRLDMSEFTDPGAAERLFRGSDRADGILTRRVREQPFCVLLLDEIEKAHPAVFDLLLQVCGEGRLTDGRGRTAFFHNAIIIMTSNLGAAHRRDPVGFEAPGEAADAHYVREVNRTFRPEFVNRLDRVVAFAALTRDDVLRVARVSLERLRARRGFAQKGVALHVSEAALAHLASEGYSARYGARALRRHLEDHLVVPAARVLAKLSPTEAACAVQVTRPEVDGEPSPPAGLPEGALLAQEQTTGGLHVRVFRARAANAWRDNKDMAVVTGARRGIDALLAAHRAVQVKEHLEHLVAQLDHGGRRPGDRRAVRENAELHSEHHRLDALYGRVLLAQSEAHALEELALQATFEGGAVSELLAEAQALHARVRREMPRVLVAQEPRRDRVAIVLHECDDKRAMNLWLVPLLEALHARGWEGFVHFDGDPRLPRDEWPDARRWGPPRAAPYALQKLTDPDRGFRNALLTVRGEDAGALLALEAGLHVWDGLPRTGDKAHLHVVLATMETRLTDTDWEHPRLEPLGPEHDDALKRAQPARSYAAASATYKVMGQAADLALRHANYWPGFEEVALIALLRFEEGEGTDRSKLFRGVLDLPLND